MKQIVRLSLGTVLLMLGMAGMVLPVLQGWLFLALGALVLSVDIPIFDRLVRWIENRVPQVKKPLERLRNFLKGPVDPQ